MGFGERKCFQNTSLVCCAPFAFHTVKLISNDSIFQHKITSHEKGTAVIKSKSPYSSSASVNWLVPSPKLQAQGKNYKTIMCFLWLSGMYSLFVTRKCKGYLLFLWKLRWARNCCLIDLVCLLNFQENYKFTKTFPCNLDIFLNITLWCFDDISFMKICALLDIWQWILHSLFFNL